MYNDNRRPEAQKEPFFRRISRWIGILSSLLVVLFLIYWVIGLGRRDASEVPVIAAMEGEARTLPEDPGGQESEYEGLEVNSVLEGKSPELSSDVVVAPQPDGLENVDPAVIDQSTIEAEEVQPVEITIGAEGTIEGTEGETDLTSEADINQETADGLTPRSDVKIAKPMRRPELLYVPSVQTPKAEVPAPTVADEIAQELASKPAVEEQPAQTVVATPEPEPAPAPTPEPAPATEDLGPRLPSGTPLIQLAANSTAQATRDQWASLQANNGDLLGNKSLYIEKTVLNGKTYYRLRVQGFSGAEETRSTCAALMARNVQCLAVTAQ